jgi:hypothetical protein
MSSSRGHAWCAKVIRRAARNTLKRIISVARMLIAPRNLGEREMDESNQPWTGRKPLKAMPFKPEVTKWTARYEPSVLDPEKLDIHWTNQTLQAQEQKWLRNQGPHTQRHRVFQGRQGTMDILRC